MSFLEKYSEVFDSNDNVTACGRVKCIELIREAKKIDKDTDYGSEDTGYINVENMKNLHKRMINGGC